MGFYVLISDNENKAIETQYWKDDFLKIQSINDEYYKTKEFLNLTKDFVSKRLLVDSNISKADKIDLLNRSVEYFKKREVFNKSEFEEEVFKMMIYEALSKYLIRLIVKKTKLIYLIVLISHHKL